MHIYLCLPLAASVFAAVRMTYDSANPSCRPKDSWTASCLGLSFVPLPAGLFFAQAISNMTFSLEDTYFTKETIALDKISWINVGFAFANTAIIIGTSIGMPDVSHVNRCSFVRFWLRTRGFWLNLAQVSAPFISFFVLVPQWSYLCN